MLAPTIAVIDTDPSFLLLMHDLLTDEGYETSLWCDSDSAFAMLQRTRPDLVILDLWLTARQSGWGILYALWNDPTTRTIPVIVCTSDEMLSAPQTAALRKRHCAVVPKPFDLGAQLELIETMLDDAALFHPRVPGGVFETPLTLDR